MTYLDFHLYFLVVPTILFTILAFRNRQALGRRFWLALLGVSPIAVVYTAPWDQHLIRERVWWYGEDRVIGAFMGVPYEEYLFMAVQPILVGALLLWLLARGGSVRAGDLASGGGEGHAGPGLIQAPPPADVTGRLLAAAAIAVPGLAIGIPALGTESGTYLGLLLTWATPILAALVAGAWSGLRWFGRAAFGAWAAATLYLCVADRIAIGAEVWTISSTKATGIMIAGLPLEEALFFALTNGLVVAGAMLFLLPGLPRGRT